jgi:diguanylate cyclase (GGDEF)-like protein
MDERPPGTPGTSRPPLVLLAQDQEWSARSIQNILGPRGYAVMRAHGGRQALEQARAALPDAILLDDGLHDVSSVALCGMLRSDRHTSTIPIIMMTSASATRARRLEAIRAGAWELLPLPPDAEELLLRLGAYVKAKLVADRARDDGLIDRSTGFYNVRGLLHRAAELAAEAHRYERPLACVVVNIQRSENNGILPAQQPAAALDALGVVLRAAVRSSDAVGTLGPAQFAVLMPGTDGPGASRLAERLLERVDAMAGSAPAEASAQAGYFGVTNYKDVSFESAELLVRATLALREGGGSDRVRGYDVG